MLTAAHCTTGRDAVDAIEIGRYDLKNDALSPPIDFEFFHIDEVNIHPKYADLPDTNSYDLAALKLYGKSRFRPVRLNHDTNVPKEAGENLTAAGWGIIETGSGDTSPGVPHEIQTHYVPNDDCEKSEGQVKRWTRFKYEGLIFPEQMCAHEEGKGACMGDSGGPLLLHAPDTFGAVQVGSVSFGVECAHKAFPVVYTRMSSVTEFLQEAMCGLSGYPPVEYGCFDCGKTYSGEETMELTVDIKMGTLPGSIGFVIDSIYDRKIYRYVPIGSYSARKPEEILRERVELLNNHEYRLVILGNATDSYFKVLGEDFISETPAEGHGHKYALENLFTLGNPPIFPSSNVGPTSAPSELQPCITIALKFDFKPFEVAWAVRQVSNSDGELERPILVDHRSFGYYFTADPFSSTKESVNLPSAEGKYEFKIFDEGHNGMCCEYGSGKLAGSYKAFLGPAPESDSASKLLLSGSSPYTDMANHTFVIPEDWQTGKLCEAFFSPRPQQAVSTKAPTAQPDEVQPTNLGSTTAVQWNLALGAMAVSMLGVSIP